MKIGFIGVGLIGGSMLKRLSQQGEECFLFDKNEKVLADAIAENNAKMLQDYNNLDLLILALSPDNLLNFIKDNHEKLKNVLIVDVCGVKTCVENIVKKYKLSYCGLHPMAGREVGGYYNSLPNLFVGANVVVTSKILPPQVQKLIDLLGFGKIVFATSAKHDEIIGYTSQLCHIVSNAYAKNPIASKVEGFTGGSFEDLTRVGKMDAKLWVELFDKNRENLVNDINILIEKLKEYADCLKSNDNEKLQQLITEGSEILQKTSGREDIKWKF